MLKQSFPIAKGFIVGVMALTIAACGGAVSLKKDAKPAEKKSPVFVTNSNSLSNTGYQIQPGDKLDISVYGEDELQKEVTVGPGGGITFPLIGDMNAKGKSVDELREEVRQRLATYIPEASVSVSIKEVIGNKVHVLGQVANPGEYVLSGATDVMQALSMAGGVTAFAATKKIKILRRDQQSGKQAVIPFNYSDIIKGRNLEQNILLNSGDTVVVP